MLAQFKPRDNKKSPENKKEVHSSGKKAEVSKIPLLILLRPSKKVLEKSKFYKTKKQRI